MEDSTKRAGESPERAVGFSRRNFLAGTGVVAAGAALAGLAGCSQPKNASEEKAAESATVDEHIAPGMRATATLENAEPIPPVDPPQEWTAEADFVVVGTGGGGLNAALLACEKGATVIAVEKQSTPGGASQHANSMGNTAGTGRAQKAAGMGQPESPYDRDKFLRWIEPQYQFSIDDDLMGNVVEAAGEALDWMQDHDADILFRGAYNHRAVIEGHMHKALAAKAITDKFYELGQEAGVDFHLNTACAALVVEDGRVVGIKATTQEGDVYYKGNKGVILCSGGIGMNPDMLKKYIPSAYEASVMGGPMPYHTGECTRMALGVGAGMSGYDSWNAWESELDNDTGDWTYFWGVRQVTQLGWLNIDCRGKRCNYYEFNQTNSQDPVFYQAKELPYYQNGQDRARFEVQASRIGHRAYCIFDGKFEDYMWNISNPVGGERRPTTTEDKIPEQNLFNPDWKVEFQNALDDGRMKQADTLDELAEKLGLKPEVVKDAVDQWNKNCEAGVDSGTIYPLSKVFLNPIVEPPFYGAKIGPRVCLTGAGVRVDENLHVVDENGDAIPGLYANFTTAGGINGESKYGGGLNYSSVLGGLALSFTSGYFAARTALQDAGIA